MQKRLISLFIATAAVISACCGVFYAENSKAFTASLSSEVCSSSFTFSLDTAKEALSLCAEADNRESVGSMLLALGYFDTEFFHYESRSKASNKVGLLIAHNDTSVIVVIRGTKDEEWYSNFYVGEGTEHAGFSIAADEVISDIFGYLNRHKLSDKATDIFLTGHSRGAAVANLTAARLIDKQSFKSVTAYTFACPNTTTRKSSSDGKYSSIVNLVNPQDFICYIPLPQWGYTRYGQTVQLPDEETQEDFDTLYENMKSSYLSNTLTPLRDFPQKGKAVEDIISYLALLAPTPRDYYTKEIAVGGFRLTMYDYMMKLAAVMNNESPLLHGLFMLSCKSVPEVCPITDFVFSTLTQSELKSTANLDDTPVVANHMPNAYFAWLDTLDESYFSSKLCG